MPAMRTSAFYNLAAAAGQDHEIARSTTASPVVGVLGSTEEDHILPCGEANPFGVIGFLLSEDPTQPGACDETWSGFTVASSPSSSDSSPFTPTEDLFCPSSPYTGLPELNGPYQPSISHTKVHELHYFAAEVGMQSPASYYPNSPTDSFAASEVPPLPTSSISSSPAPCQIEGINMDITSAPIPTVAGPSRPKVDRPYAQLLRDCFLSRPDYCMSLKEIYKWFRENTNKASQPGKGWQNSIRHNLSMNAAFKKQDATHAGTGRGGSRSNIWTMELWAVEGRVQSTTRYRRSNSSRKDAGRKNAQQQQQAQALGLPNYLLSGSEFSHGNGMNRAAAGRRGGVATRHARERQRAELERQQRMGSLPHSTGLSQIGSNGWSVPRAFSPSVSGFGLPDHFRLGGATAAVPSYLGLQSGVHMGHPQMYGQQLPLPSNSPALGMGNGHITAATAHMSPTQSHPTMGLGCVPTGDMPCGTNQLSPHQQHQQAPGHHQHHQHNGSFAYGSPGSNGEYTSGNGVH